MTGLKRCYRLLRGAFFPASFLVHIDEDNIGSDLDNTPPWNKVFIVPPEEPAQLSGPGDNNGKDTAAFAVDIEIIDTAERAAGPHIDDLLLFHIIEAHRQSHPLRRLSYILYVCGFAD